VPRRRHRPASELSLTLRSNLSWQSSAFRHAVRLTATLTAAMVVYRLSGLAHGYWVALTALIVLRKDYSTTAVRGLSRIVGTILGAVLATILVAVLHPDTTGLAVLFAVTAWLAFVIVRVNYGLFSICVTAYVVFLLAFAAEPVVSTVEARLVATLIGGGLAVGVYLAWPTWESRLVGPVLADLLDAQARYAGAVLACHADPRAACGAEPRADGPRRLSELREAARLARTNAELSVGRMAAEPERSRRDAPIPLDTARGVLAAAHRSARAFLTLQAQLPPEDAAPIPALAAFSTQLTERMEHNAMHLRELVPRSPVGASAEAVLARVGRSTGEPAAPPHEHPDRDRSLRRAYNELAAEIRRLDPAEVGDAESRVSLVLAECDELVDAVNSTSRLVEAARAGDGTVAATGADEGAGPDEAEPAGGAGPAGGSAAV